MSHASVAPDDAFRAAEELKEDGTLSAGLGDPEQQNLTDDQSPEINNPSPRSGMPEIKAPFAENRPAPYPPEIDWQEHPITKALSAFTEPGSPLNPAQVIADSLLPLYARTNQKVPSELLDESPIKPIPAEGEASSEEVALGLDARDAFWDFWLGHQEQMRKQCIRLMAGNIADAEDALSSAMLRAAQKFPNYSDSIINGKAWLRKLVYNVCMDHYRQDRLTEYRSFDQESDIPSNGAMFTEKPQSPEDKALSREQIRNLDECIDGLSNNLRVPLFLRCVEGWSYPDIAAELNLKADTVRKRIQLARDHLRRSNIR